MDLREHAAHEDGKPSSTAAASVFVDGHGEISPCSAGRKDTQEVDFGLRGVTKRKKSAFAFGLRLKGSRQMVDNFPARAVSRYIW
jgi:hypothetical protein